MSSLINTVRDKFLDAIRSVNPPGKWKILVVDEHSQKLLGSVLKQFDILEENVTLIESITNYRDPQPEFEAMYLLMPTSQNVDRIVKDFSGVRQYAGAHVFFIEGLEEKLFDRLVSSAAEPFLRTVKELFVNFWAAEAQTFTLQAPEMFFGLYSPPRSDSQFKAARDRLEEELRFASKIIANVCITLNEFPYIRYYVPPNHTPLGALKPHPSTRPPPPQESSGRWRTNLARGSEARAYESVEGDYATKILAFFVQNNLDNYKKANPDFATTTERPRGTLVITDRVMDMVAPFLHEFTYQAMANDLLPIEDGTRYTYKFQSSVGAYEDKTATLTDADTVWTGVRHMHMREAIDKLMADFNKFLEENAVFKGEGAASLNDMKEMLASLPQFQEQREKFSLHLSMAQECMGLFEQDKLPLVATIEQDCATGVTAEGKTPKNLVQDMVPLLDSREVVNSNKVRIVALYIQFRDGVPEEDRRRLYQHARLSVPEQEAVNSLVHLGVRINRGAGDRDTKKKIKQKPNNDEEYELSRFKPSIRTVLEEHVADKLDKTLFPYVKDQPSLAAPTTTSLRSGTPVQTSSLRSQKPAWHKAARTGGAGTDTRQRLLVFVAGGMTYSEIREAYQLSTSLNRDIYIGSTHTLTPRQFINDLQVLELGGIGSKAIPNGLKESRGGRSFQEFYDERYFTRDAPPPPRPAPAAASARQERRPAAPRMSPAASYSSNTSSVTPSVQEEKKKKKGLFRF
ncbi:Sec1-like snare protein [Roridomyces roridus]|uniref:Sec1-like snare protein n=1 Tax=Roridomyces roridus TaxID=1738132 RepID=A0AAD7FU45_9AGAR|nr:Sec1-like snare protein [Roridomyces roridus]